MIWEIKNEKGMLVSLFGDKAKGGVVFFKTLFTATPGFPI